MTGPTPVSILGGGAIGVGWAVVLADAGFQVQLFEVDESRRRASANEISRNLQRLEQYELIRSSSDAAFSRISYPETLAASVDSVTLVQECVTESLDAKRAVFFEADQHAPESAIIATSSSSLKVSDIASEIPGRERCLLAHPANPPFLLPIVEVAAAPFTDVSAIEHMTRLLEAAGMTPIRIHNEIEGLAYNRLQGAILREAYCLVRDGVIAPSDLDRLVTGGLGRRWAVIGPFATAHLNTRGGITAHAERLGNAYARMGAERGQNDPWTPDLVSAVAADLDQRLPLEHCEDNLASRDHALMALARVLRSVLLPGQELDDKDALTET